MLCGFWERLVGLLGIRDPQAAPWVLLSACRSVHTVGMAFDLDLCFIDRQGCVVRSERVVRPGRVLGARGAVCVLERAASGDPWPEFGERVRIRSHRSEDALRKGVTQ